MDRAAPAHRINSMPEMFKTMTGIEMTHVPYKGSAPALADVVGGHIALLFADPAPALPLIKPAKCGRLA